MFLIGSTGGELLRQQTLDDPTLAETSSPTEPTTAATPAPSANVVAPSVTSTTTDYGATADDHDGRVSPQLLSGRREQRGVTSEDGKGAAQGKIARGGLTAREESGERGEFGAEVWPGRLFG